MSDLFTEEDLDQEALEKEKERKAAQKKPADSGKEIPASLSFDKRLYIIDGYSVIYRNYFAHISNPLTDKNGTNISAESVMASRNFRKSAIPRRRLLQP